MLSSTAVSSVACLPGHTSWCMEECMLLSTAVSKRCPELEKVRASCLLNAVLRIIRGCSELLLFVAVPGTGKGAEAGRA